MYRFFRILLSAIIGFIVVLSSAIASEQDDAQGFVEGSHLNILNRTLYFNRDFRDGGFNHRGTNARKPGNENGYAEESAQGLMAFYRSGFTQGTVGFGVDSFTFLGLLLDSGGGRVGNLIAPINDRGHPETSWAQLGGVVKVRVSNTVLKYGGQRVVNPVMDTSDARLLPQTATGFTLESKELNDFVFNSGYITSMSNFNSTNHDDDLLIAYADNIGNSIEWAGATYGSNEPLKVSVYGSQVEDTWNRYFFSPSYTYQLNDTDSISMGFNVYRTDDTGKSLAGKISNTDWSASTRYATAGNTVTFSYQKIDDDAGFDYIGTDAPGLPNSVQYADFNSPGEKSFRLRYDLDLSVYGISGLSLSSSYISGHDINADTADPKGGFYDPNSHNEKHWERDIFAKYILQNGAAKDLSFTVMQATHRGSSNQIDGDVDEVRFITEYPMEIL